MLQLNDAFTKLENYLKKENYRGYDPYDTLNSFFPFKSFGKWIPVLAIQFQKRNPINIRRFLGIKKEINPKAFGLFLQAYSLLYASTNNKEYLDKANYFFDWLNANYSKSYSGKCWGYNFPWANQEKYMQPFVPSAVVTGFVVKGLYEYYKVSDKQEVVDLMKSAALFLDADLEKFVNESGVSISYTPLQKDICYNASLLAAESLAKVAALTNNLNYKETAIKAVDFVIAQQKSNGCWNYSIDLDLKKEDTQIDFHQGYVLESIYEIKTALNIVNSTWENAITNGLQFYMEQQFNNEGWSYWRLPKKYPVEIHNQSQGIITLLKLQGYHPNAGIFAQKIAQWTITHMQNEKGYFYYQNHKNFKNKIAYMRWSQAWMFLALTALVNNDSKGLPQNSINLSGIKDNLKLT